jgi:asparagine synthase (glutamine-hydrolysing)
VSGIVGIVYSGSKTGSPLASVVRALAADGGGEKSISCVGAVGMGTRGGPGQLSGVAEAAGNGSTLTLAFHGSIYNLKELLERAPRDGNVIQQLLELYRKNGIAFLRLLRGEFVLAVWDGTRDTLYLATDRFRVQPLFYYRDDEKLIFASRMKGIAACLDAQDLAVNGKAIVHMAGFSVIPTPETIFKEVMKLPPGYVLTYRRGDIEIGPFWKINFEQESSATESELVDKLKAHFREAVTVRLASEGHSTNIGTFLSGGVDSSTLTGALTQITGKPVKSFSIGFNEDKFNEINYARIAARAFGSEHYEYFVKPRDVLEAIPVLMESFDEPFANASSVPTYFCAKLARENGVDVLYAGDGGDELFAGNQRYADQRLFDYYCEIPEPLRRLLVKPLVFALANASNVPLFVKAKKYIERASIPYPQRLTSYGFYKIFPMLDLLTPDFLNSIGDGYDPDAPFHDCYREAPAKTELDRQLYLDLKITISDNDILKVTKMVDAAGLSVRFPFLDHVFAEFAASVPARIKMQGRQLRSFFKKAYADLLPTEVRTKTKHGFGLPIPIWLRSDRDLNELLRETVLSPRSVQRGYFRPEALEKLIELHRDDKTSFYGTILWNLMILEMWHRKWLESD